MSMNARPPWLGPELRRGGLGAEGHRGWTLVMKITPHCQFPPAEFPKFQAGPT